ncbi:MAG: glycosyltransferase [Burkholderiales bacterium]
MPLPPAATRAQKCTRTRLSGGPSAPVWAIAVFAHNEAGRVAHALASIAAAAGGREVEIFVLDNGSSDATADEVHALAASVPYLNLVEITLGDKANAWNLFVHDLALRDDGSAFELCFFMDADVTLERDAMDILAFTLEEMPGALAAGGMPANGRDRDAWRARMVANGMLAGNFYCLRGTFVAGLRAQGVRLPVGLIGEDFLVSWLVVQRIGAPAPLPSAAEVRLIPGAPASVRIVAAAPTPCVFHQSAQFRFRSLSPWRPGDIRIYLRRKWRYTLRGLQFQMLTQMLARFGIAAMPANVDELYRDAPLPSRLQWAGIDTLMRTAAVLRIRAQRRRAQATLDGLP